MNIRTKFVLSSIVVVGLVLAMVGGTGYVLRQGIREVEQEIKDGRTAIQSIQAIQTGLLAENDGLKAKTFAPFVIPDGLTIEALAFYQTSIDAHRQAIEELFSAADDSEVNAQAQTAVKGFLDFVAGLGMALEQGYAGALEATPGEMTTDDLMAAVRAIVSFSRNLNTEAESVNDEIEALVEAELEKERQAFDRLERSESAATTASWIILALIPVVFVGQFLLTIRPSIVSIQKLQTGAAAIGDGDLEHRLDIHTGDEIEQLADEFNQMGGNLADSRRSLEAEKKISEDHEKALQNELEKGRQLQQDFLPTLLPQPTGWEMQAFLTPAREVSGDFYDGFLLPNGLVGVVIADVCDKGVGAALFMALSRSLMRVFSGQIHLDGRNTNADSGTPSDGGQSDHHTTALTAVRLTNDYIAQTHADTNMFATLFFGVLDPETGSLTYINAGHEPLIILGATGETTRLGPTGPAVGVIPQVDFGVKQVNLDPGSMLVGYTDGVTDARNPSGESFTEERLMAMLDSATTSATVMATRINDTVREHIGSAEQFDDITVLAVRRSSS